MASLTSVLPSNGSPIACDPCLARPLLGPHPLAHAFARPAKPILLSSNETHSPCVIVRAHFIETSAVETSTTTPATANSNWDSFSAAASGEWDGVTVTFDRDGEAQQLPEYYVPQAYRDWEVQLYDWTSQCSMLADATGLQYTLRRLMPTVGCEADAVAFTEDLQAMFTPGGAAITALGGYSTGPFADLSSKDLFKAQSEHCFPLEAAGQRIRIVHNFKRMGPEGVWKVLSVEVHRERRDGPHNGRRELAGCGGGMDTFSQTPVVEISSLKGMWKVIEGFRHVAVDGQQDAKVGYTAGVDTSTRIDIASLPGLIGLRLGAWSSAQIVGDADVEIVAGLLLPNGKMKAVRQSIKNGKLNTTELMTLEKEKLDVITT
ncbi:hypothetical protein NADE_005778 [Nannochloris sp. 'desiccata']|nr:hypothetical protein NADE_005778 [Chlorella desiccata (nom. nud.)]